MAIENLKKQLFYNFYFWYNFLAIMKAGPNVTTRQDVWNPHIISYYFILSYNIIIYNYNS